MMGSLEEMQSRHRKEQKDLQSRITQKKKGATKKTRKGVNTECDELERQLKEKQGQELRSLDDDNEEHIPQQDDSHQESTGSDEDPVNGTADTLPKTSIAGQNTPASDDTQPRQKRNRQKERLARRAAEQEAAIEEAKKEASSQPDQKAVERDKMLRQFKAQGLQEKLIRPDGHCLFSAVADQLSQAGIPLEAESESVAETGGADGGYRAVRRAAALYIERHPDDFVAWLDEPLDQYVHKIRDTAEWGGHLELLALAKSYNIEICVLQDGAAQNIEPGLGGEGRDGEPAKIWLAYYRHGFGLGEHYNSLRKAP